jgi:Cof subfamily protein (haloacid dehalogenase superfamily)
MSGSTPPIRLLISDVDGTLVRSDKSLADATIAAVRQARDAGLPVTLISARPPSGMYWIADALDLDGPFGAFNGGVLFRRDRTVIERHGLHRKVAETVLTMLREAGITRWVFADDQWLASDHSNPHTGSEVKSADLQPIVTDDFSDRLDRIDKIVGISDDPDLLVELEARAIAAVGGGATIARSQPYYLDITAPPANKGDGVAFLANAFAVPLDEIVVIGDQANDLPMFARAGLSIAMGQATPEVKAKAMLTTEANDADGVAAAITGIILPRFTAPKP